MEFKDDYRWQSGWIHDYYCDFDGTELIFNINQSDNLECPLCHKKYNDIKRKRAWILKYRYVIFDNLEEYSKKYIEEKDNKYLKYIIDALNYYSLNYDKFEIHNKEGKIYKDYINSSNRCGKITAQGLSEAIISIKICKCLENIKDFLPKNTIKNVYNLLFIEIYKLLKPQVNKIHNIKCYEIVAIGMMGIISNNKEMIDFAFNSEYSFFKQLDEGVTKDNFWKEGSFHYHLFVLRPILEFLKLIKKYEYNISPKYYIIAKEMLNKVYETSFNDCTLPSPNDGWPNRNLQNYIDVYELGNKVFTNEFDKIIENIKQNINTTKTTHLLDTGFSILKNEYWDIFIKYGDKDLNHAHPDKLNIEVKIENDFLTHDLSTSGYGSNITDEFYRKTYSHNTIVINEESQNLDCSYDVKYYDKNKINVEVKNIYDKYEVSREIKIDTNKFKDNITIKNVKKDKIKDKIDYLFHCDAELITKVDYINIDKIQNYPYLCNIRKINNQKDIIKLVWNLKNKDITSTIDLSNKELYLCDSPNNPNTESRTTVLIRNTSLSDNINFLLEWSYRKERI